MKINPFSRFMLGVAFVWVAIIPNLRAQTTPAKPQLFYIHEDPVTPAMVNEYEKVSKELISQCKKHGIQDGWLTIQDDDHKYYTIVPVANMAELDKDPLEPLQEKMGKEAFGALFKAFDQCYPSHRDYLVSRMPTYSYVPDENSQTEYAYRKYLYFYYEPRNQSQMAALFKQFKELYVSKKGKVYYNVYASRFGSNENFILIEDLAKSEADMKEIGASDRKLLGTEFDKLYAELKKLSRRTETKIGHVRPDLSYSVAR